MKLAESEMKAGPNMDAVGEIMVRYEKVFVDNKEIVNENMED